MKKTICFAVVLLLFSSLFYVAIFKKHIIYSFIKKQELLLAQKFFSELIKTNQPNEDWLNLLDGMIKQNARQAFYFIKMWSLDNQITQKDISELKITSFRKTKDGLSVSFTLKKKVPNVCIVINANGKVVMASVSNDTIDLPDDRLFPVD